MLIKYLRLPIFILFLWLSDLNCYAVQVYKDEVIVVTHVQSRDLSLQQIKKIYLGMGTSKGGSNNNLITTLPHQNRTRTLFNVKIIGLTEARIRSFWAQMRFSGRGKPPVELENPEMVIEYVLKNNGSIGYLPYNTVIPAQLKVIYSTMVRDG